MVPMKNAQSVPFKLYFSNVITILKFLRHIQSLGIHKIKENKENLKSIVLCFLTPGLFDGTKNTFFKTFSTFFFSNHIQISSIYHTSTLVYLNFISYNFYSPSNCRLQRGQTNFAPLHPASIQWVHQHSFLVLLEKGCFS